MHARSLQIVNTLNVFKYPSELISFLRDKISRPVIDVFSIFHKEVWLLAADDAQDQDKNRVLFVGRTEERHFISKLFFGGNCTHQSLGHHWLWRTLFYNEKIGEGCSFSVIQTRWQISRFFRLKSMFCVPAWVFGSVSLTSAFDLHIKKNRCVKKKLREIKKGNFTIEISSDPLLFDEFYHKMHEPYMKKRYGKCAINENYDRIKARFQQGSEILFVKSGSQRIAGMIICYKSGDALAYRLGVRDGDFKWVEKGAISALYFHALKYCRSIGYKKLKLGGSRPFFSDGVLNYKLKSWNMKIDDYSKQFYFIFKPLKTSNFNRNFLSQHQFISLQKDKMIINTFCKGGKEKTIVKETKERYFKKGLTEVAAHYLG